MTLEQPILTLGEPFAALRREEHWAPR
ncbi:hypothetical protein CHELA1G11_14788 [Hyphomicrobiales bacterium]|nr:hypothetical protein CHELA1G2_14319 [Hyphomicrobiales bacterium]CAH1680890.1 hypothetical protein CHELA1G11_14788 [Hyphomicrobiales bacterium]